MEMAVTSCSIGCIPFRRLTCQSPIYCSFLETNIKNKDIKLSRRVDASPSVQTHAAWDLEPAKVSSWHEDSLKAGFAVACWALLGLTSTAECVRAEPVLSSPSETVSVEKPVTLGRMFAGKIGYSFFYPEGFIVATNRKGDEERQADGSQALALVGNFSSFDTISVIRFPLEEGDSTAAPLDLADKLLTRGNVRTDFISATRREQKDSTEIENGPQYTYEYVTEVCRGNLEEGKGGIPDCVSPSDGSLLGTVVRHHVASVTLHEGEFYVISASSAEGRWNEMASALRASVSSFSFA